MDGYMLNSGDGNTAHTVNGMNNHPDDNRTNAPSIVNLPHNNQTTDLSITAPLHGPEFRAHASGTSSIPDVGKSIVNNNPNPSIIFNTSGTGYNYTSGNQYTGVNDYSKYTVNNNQEYVPQESQCTDSNNHCNPTSNAGTFQNVNVAGHVQAGCDQSPQQVFMARTILEERKDSDLAESFQAGYDQSPQQVVSERTTLQERKDSDQAGQSPHQVLMESTTLQEPNVEALPSVTEPSREKSDEKLSCNKPHDASDVYQKDNDNTVSAPKNDNQFDLVSVNFFEIKCKFCSATFERRKAFKRHITNEHGILPYVCNICGMGYDHKSDLKAHAVEHKKQNDTKETSCEVGDEAVKLNLSSKLEFEHNVQKQQNESSNAKVVQTKPEDNKSNLSKSLHLLAQVSQMRDTREKNPKRVTSTVNADRKAKVEEDKPVVNKRKRGRPRRVTRNTAISSKRKQGQPRKARRASKAQLNYAEEDDTSDEAENEEKPIPKIKVEVRKGNYKLRPQKIEKDYSTQLKVDKSSSLFKCRYCDVEFKTEAKMLRHENMHKDFPCTTCGEEFSSYKDMKQHEDTHFPDEMKCHFCNEAFKNKNELWKHEESYDKTITCRWCGATYDERSELDMHERLHFFSKNSGDIFECHFCKKICKSRKSWKSHLVSHSNIRAFDCKICGKKYKQQGSFNIHMQRHNDTFYKFTCQFCGKKYGQKALLIIHERTHTNERPFKCTHCDLAYPSKNQLDHHMQRVNGIKHMCSFCGKQLNSRSSLEIHERIHTGTRPIKCDFCDMSFIEASSYKYHLRLIHTGERFECKFCGKLCKARGVLNAHMRVHTGERPFKCPHCDKAFRSGNVLRTHVQGIHMGVRHKCEKCGREFAQTSALNTHKKLVHDGMKWKDIQFQRKVNRQNREKRDRLLIVNALTGKEHPKGVEDDAAMQEPVRYMEPVNKTLDTASNQATPSIPAYSDIERSLTSSIMASAPSVMASVPTVIASAQPIMASAASIMASAAASVMSTPPPVMVSAPSMMVPPHSIVAPGMMPPAARLIPESDRGSVDVVFPPVIAGTPMYHVL